MFVYDTALGKLSGDELIAFVEGEEGEEGEGEHSDDEETVNPVLPTGGDILYAALFFFALWAALKYVLLPPLQRVRAERARKIADARDAADNATADMGTAQADYDATLAQARTEANEILEAARAEADAERARIMGAAEAEAAELRAAAEAEVATARDAALRTLAADVTDVAAGAASTLLGRPIGPDEVRPVTERALQGGRT